MLVDGAILLAIGLALLSWCAAGLGRANPGRRVPGRLPAVAHPPGYMPVGAVGILSVVLGTVLACGSASIYAWIIAAASGSAAIGIPFSIHNRRLP